MTGASRVGWVSAAPTHRFTKTMSSARNPTSINVARIVGLRAELIFRFHSMVGAALIVLSHKIPIDSC